MNILEVQKKYNTQLKCLKLLEKLRWGKVVKCPYCASKETSRQKTDKTRHSCKNCKRSFSVLVDTIFEDTRLPLPKWFALITLMLNSKSGISAKELQRNIGGSYKTSYYAAMRVRIGMLIQNTKLNGMIEMDESYFGGKARKTGKHTDNIPDLASITNKRGRGTNKVSVAGMVQRKGMVKTKLIEKLTKRNLLFMLKTYAKKDNSILITDGFRSYKELEKYIDRLEINHSKSFSKGIVHVNTIEGFWSYVKNGIRGSFKAISKKYLPLYLIEYEWKFNHRNYRGDEFEKFLKNALKQDKELEYWKAKSGQKVKEIAYN
ncbi:IS1595 family transposase [uncultured Maribacter sp.]|uniref:IS1595 family transposase n=1 Tax=uncultured Maribacter sp. TaxID=431308 RepID=UPI0030EC62A9|tara:strand:- start:7144 stop:8097 length:954 start_codon:yes stop_codon:yes gene_type:complete